MKQHLFLIIFLFFRTFFVFSQNVDSVFIEKMVLQECKNFSKKAAFVENSDYNSYDLIYQKMVWEIDPAFRYIKGEITSKIMSASDSLVLITFDLSDSLNVDSVVYNKNLLEYTHSNNKLKITFPDTLRMNETDSFSVVYSGIPASSGYGTFVQTTHNNVPVIWTLSEPYGAKDWWPCKESLFDKIDSIDIIVTCPEQYRTASNGIVVADTVINGFRTMHWKHRYPIATYLVAIAITNYSVYSDFVDLSENRKLEILNYVFPENLYNAKQNTGVTVDFIKLYNQLIGEYPFSSEKYGHAQFGWGGGMEHQSMSFMTNFGFNIVAHELAHQWFGDYITTGNWHDIWLNEGFATYFNGLVYENIRPENEWLTWKRNNVAQIISSSDGSVYVEHTTNINRILITGFRTQKGLICYICFDGLWEMIIFSQPFGIILTILK